MKQTRSVINSLLVCGVAFAMVPTLSAQTTKEQVAKVIRVGGAARCQIPGGGWQDLRPGTVIAPGSVIQSGIDGGSYVDVVLGGGTGALPSLGSADYAKIMRPAGGYTAPAKQTVLHLYSNTVLGLDKLVASSTGASIVTETELDLRKGHVLGNVKRQSTGSEFRIRYPKGVATVNHGGVFDMSVEAVKELKQGAAPGGELYHVTFAVSEGSGAITFTGPDGVAVTQSVQTLQVFDSSNPTMVGPIPPAELANIQSTLTTLNLPPVVAGLIPDLNQVGIEYVTTTIGTPVTTGDARAQH